MRPSLRAYHPYWSVIVAAAAITVPGRADDLVDIKVDSKARKYGEKNPVQAAKQEFSLSKAGMVKLVYKTDMIYKDSRGGQGLEEVNLSNYTIGTGIFQKRTPDTAIPGQPYTFEQHWLCANREKPLNLRATLVAPHYTQSSDQLAADQVLTITFIPFEKISSEAGPAPGVDVAGKWLHGDQNATLTFTPTSIAGEYAVVEQGYDNIKGTAKVKGNKVYIDWVTTTARDGKQKKGVTIVEIKPDGTHGEGWSVGDGGTGGERWTAFPGTKAKPTGTAATPGTGTTAGPAGTGSGKTPGDGTTTSPGNVFPGTTAGSTPPVGGIWEYKVVDLPTRLAVGDGLQMKLAELGKDGWELASTIVPPLPPNTTVNEIRFVFKRAKR